MTRVGAVFTRRLCILDWGTFSTASLRPAFSIHSIQTIRCNPLPPYRHNALKSFAFDSLLCSNIVETGGQDSP
jgi:hypothetical protein